MKFCHHCGVELTEMNETCSNCNKAFFTEVTNVRVNKNDWQEKLNFNQKNLQLVKMFIFKNKYLLCLLLILFIIFLGSRQLLLGTVLVIYVIGIYLYPLLMNSSEMTKLEEGILAGIKYIKNALKDAIESKKVTDKFQQTAIDSHHIASNLQREGNVENLSYVAENYAQYKTKKNKVDVIDMFIFAISIILGAIGAYALFSGEFKAGVLGVIVIGGMAALIVYFIPTLVSSGSSKAAIFLTNIFFGWTLLGWLICLIWAVNNNGTTRLNEMMIEKIDLDARKRG